MTKILIVSDNHFQDNTLTDITKKHADADYFVNCGDTQWQPDDPRLTNFIVVKGNNDFGPRFPDDERLDVDGKKIFITHGHMQHVYNHGAQVNELGTEKLVKYVREQGGADIILYGHTHVPEAHYDGEILVINPGSTNFPRSFRLRFPTYAVLTFTNGTPEVRFYHGKTHEDITDKIL